MYYTARHRKLIIDEVDRKRGILSNISSKIENENLDRRNSRWANPRLASRYSQSRKVGSFVAVIVVVPLDKEPTRVKTRSQDQPQ